MKPILTAALVIMTIVVCGSASGTVGYQYTEDFSTRQYEDPVHTTALWDTAAAQIGFHPFEVLAMGAVATPGQAAAVAVSGDIAYVADGSLGIKAVDTTDPSNPVIVGGVSLGGTAKDLVIDGDYLYVALGLSGIAVIDISTAASPSLAHLLPLSGNARGLDIEGDMLCVAAGSGGLRIVSIRSPALPYQVGFSPAPTAANDVVVRGDVAYVADGAAGLITIDVSSMTAPTVLATIATGGTAQGIAVDGSIAYVADGANGLVTLWVQDPSLPASRSQIGTPGTALDVEVSGDYAYVCDGSSGLLVFDVTALPFLKDTYASSSPAFGVALNGNYAFLAETDGLTMLSVAEKFPPTVIRDAGLSCSGIMFVDGNYLYVSIYGVYTTWIDVVNISSPGAAGLAYSYHDPAKNFRAFALQGDYLYAAVQPESPNQDPYHLEVWDIHNPLSPTLVRDYPGLDPFRDLVPHGDYLFSSTYVFDISNPTLSAPVAGLPYAIDDGIVHGNYFIGKGTPYGFADFWYVIYDITNPAAPVYLGAPVDVNWPMGFTAFGDHLFIGDLHSLYTLDITDPTSPVITSIDDNESYGGRLPLVAGDEVYLISRATIHFFDITNPADPVLTGTHTDYSNLNYPEANRMHGDLMIVGTGTEGAITIWKMFQRDYFYGGNIAESSEIDSADLTIVRARLSPVGSPDIMWSLSSDDGANWQPADPSDAWLRITQPGTALRWRSEHPLPAAGGNVTATQLGIEWRYESAVIDSIADVPEDQGGWVRVHFTRSGYDFSDEAVNPISHYEIVRDSDNQTVLTVFASAEDKFTARVPTLVDGTPTAYHIVAHSMSSGMSFASPADSGMSVDNIAPGVPAAFTAHNEDDNTVRLNWESPETADVTSFRVYRGTESDFTPDGETRVAETTDHSWIDHVNTRGVYFYKVTSVDHAGNESLPAQSGPVRIGGREPLPDRFALYQNHPNPFNPSTLIAYDVPKSGGRVRIQVFDVGGRLVRTLVNGELSPGRRTIAWDGRDRNGRRVASGVYFYRLETAGFTKTLKMTLLQ